MKERDGKQLTYVKGPFSKEHTADEVAAVERVATETGKMPNRKWRRHFERWKARQAK